MTEKIYTRKAAIEKLRPFGMTPGLWADIFRHDHRKIAMRSLRGPMGSGQARILDESDMIVIKEYLLARLALNAAEQCLRAHRRRIK